MRFTVFVLAIVLAAAQLHADIEGTIAGEVFGDQRPQKDAKVVVEVDPRWGHRDDAEFAKFRERYNGLPEVSGRAETSTDANGKWSVRLKVKVSDHSKLPKTREVEGSALVEKPYIIVTALVTVDGFRPSTQRAKMLENGETDWLRYSSARTVLSPTRFVTATLLRQDGKSAGGMRLIGHSRVNYEPPTTFEVVADPHGRVKIDDRHLENQLLLYVADEGLAFADYSKAWGVSLQGGENALGTLSVVSGGGIRLRALSAITNQPIAVTCAVYASNGGSRVRLDVSSRENGEATISGLPPGSYEFDVNPPLAGRGPSLWYAHFDITITPGETVDLGDIALEPHHSLDVLAVNEEGVAVETYQVRMELVPGTSASFIRPRRNEKGIYSSAFCTAKKTKLDQLVRGTWRVTVIATGYSNGKTEVQIPAAQPLTVTLGRGGYITLRDADDGSAHRSFIRAIAVDAPCYEAISRMPAADVEEAFKQGLDPSMVYPHPTAPEEKSTMPAAGWGPVPEGTYTLIIGGALRVDNVVVRKGETTTVDVDYRAPAEVSVRATEQGAPKGSVTLVVMTLVGGRTAAATVTTDNAGIGVIKALAPGSYRLVTKEEFDWLSKPPSSPGRPNPTLPGAINLLTVSPGDRIDYEIELFDPGRVWLTVKVKPRSGKQMEEATINDLYHGRPVIDWRTTINANGTFDFGPVRAGTYEFRDGDLQDTGSCYVRFEVNQPPRQTIELDLSPSKVTVSLKIPKAFERVPFHTNLIPYCEDPSAMSLQVRAGTATVLAPDKVEFTDVVPGSYLLSSWTEGMVPRRQIIEYKEVIEVPKTKRVTVRFDGSDPYLSIRLRSEQERHWGTGLEKDGRRLWVEVLNSKGEREMIGGAPVAVVPEDSSSRSWRVKPGRYTVRLFGRGFETRTFEDVDVSRDKGAVLDVDLKQTAIVRVQVPNIEANALLCAEISVEAFDKDGNALSTDSGGMRANLQPRAGQIAATDRHRGPHERVVLPVCELVFMNVPVQSARIRIHAPGYKPVELELKHNENRGHRYTVQMEEE